MPARVLDRRVKRRERLHVHLALDVAAPGPAGHLREQLKCPLTSAKVRDVQAQVGVNDPDQRHVREVQPLGDHLRAQQNIDFAGAKIAEDAPVILLALERVGVHPLDLGHREALGQGGLNLLRAQADEADRRVATTLLRTLVRRGLDVAANVAHQLLRGAMVGQRHAAIRALGNEAAVGALQRRRPTAPVEEEHHLLFFLEPLQDRLAQLRRENTDALLLARHTAHIDHAHERHVYVVHPLGEREQAVLAPLHVVVTLHRRRRRAEHHRRALKLAAHHREVAGVVARCFLLLVRVLVLLVDDHEAKRLHRREHRRASADDDARPALPNLVPLVVPLPGGEVAVQHGDQCLLRPVAEPRLEPLNRLRRQRNLRHQHDGALPLAKRVCDRLQIHLRLAAAGHAVQ